LYLSNLSTVGAFGNVIYAWHKKNKKNKVAIKAMKKNDIISSKHVDHIENEKKILELINHPFIVRHDILFYNLLIILDELLRIYAR